MRRVMALACLLVVGCGKSASSTKHDAAATPPGDAAVAPVELAERPLGLPDLAAFAWRDRAGHPKFREARTAEARGDWQAVVSACRQALVDDPTHLEAAWLLAAGLGRQGKTAELVAPLQTAVAGDFAKWGAASLELPALAEFRATPSGQAWIKRVDENRAAFAAAVEHATIVIASGDLFAIDPRTQRWFRLTRTAGGVIGGLIVPSARKLAYVARVVPRYGKATKQRELAIGVVDLASGTVTRPAELGTKKHITVGFATKTASFIVATGTPKPVWRRLEDDRKLVALPPKTTRLSGPYLEVKSRNGALTVLPLSDVVADWDENGLASAIRIGASNRVVSVPSPGLIDGNTASWSPQKSHLAFVAQLDETCAPGTVSAAAVVADVMTGKTTELVRATKGIAIEWISERQLAVAADDGVVIYDLDGAPPRMIEGAQKLVTPKKRTRCTDEPEPESEPDTDDPTPDSDEVVEPPDAGVVEPMPSGKNSTPENR